MQKLYIYLILLVSCPIFIFSQETTNNQNYFEIERNAQDLFNNSKNTNVKNKWLHRWLWNHRLDYDKSGNLYDYSKESNNLNYFDHKADKTLSVNKWIPLGPIKFPPSYESRSCYSMGRITCIAFHPKNKNIFWVGTPGGGIWKTENSGTTWFPLTENLSTMAFSHIAVDPANPNILYAASGDYDINSGSYDGIFKSTDGGTTWFKTGLKDNSKYASSTIRKIIINSENSNEIIAGGRKGIWKSTDAGTTWTTVCDSIISDMEVNPNNSKVVFAAMVNNYNSATAGILKSNDFGTTWDTVPSLIPPKNYISRIELSISAANPNYIYALCSQSSSFYSLNRSTDNGNTWSIMSQRDTTNNILGAWGGDKSDGSGQGVYDLVLFADPYDKDKIYTGGINIWMSQNGGKDFNIASFWIYVFGESIHADHHYTDFNVLDGYYYWCNDGGVYRTKEIKPGDKDWVNLWIDKSLENIKPGAPDVKFPTKWENISSGLAITEFYKVSVMKNGDNILAGGSQDNSCYYFKDGQWLNYIPNYDGMETMIDNDNPDIFYGVWQMGGLCRTTDAGKTIQAYLTDNLNGESGAWVTPVAMDPNNGKNIYIGMRSLWKSTDRGDTWIKAINFDSSLFISPNRRQLSIIKSSYNSSTHLCCYKESTYFQDTSKNWVRTPGQLWLTKDNGINWINSKKGLPLDSLDIISIEYDRIDPNIMWAGFYYGANRNINLFKSTDGGDNWFDVSKEMPAGLRLRAIVHQQGDLDYIYAGTNKGVYYTNNESTKWLPFSEDLPNTIINDLEINPRTNEIIAATYGRGMWKTNLLLNDIPEISTNKNISIFPNPAQDKFELKIEGEILPNTELIIMDLKGIELNRISINQNRTQIPLNLSNGIYFVMLNFGNKKYYNKMIIQK